MQLFIPIFVSNLNDRLDSAIIFSLYATHINTPNNFLQYVLSTKTPDIWRAFARFFGVCHPIPYLPVAPTGRQQSAHQSFHPVLHHPPKYHPVYTKLI